MAPRRPRIDEERDVPGARKGERSWIVVGDERERLRGLCPPAKRADDQRETPKPARDGKRAKTRSIRGTRRAKGGHGVTESMARPPRPRRLAVNPVGGDVGIACYAATIGMR